VPLIILSKGDAIGYAVTLPEVNVFNQKSEYTGFNWLNVLTNIYYSGIMISVLVSGLSFLRLYNYRPSHTAFSFFKIIHVPKVESSSQQLIHLHEQAHKHYWHSLDIVFFVIVRAIFWFNPVVYFLFRALKQEHEFEADAFVIKHTNQAEVYCNLLVDQTFGETSAQSIAHSFHSKYSLLNRIYMITNTQTQSVSWWKRIASVPILVAIFCVSFLQTEVVAQNVDGEIYQSTEQMPEFVGGPNNMMAYLSKELVYPPKCRDQKIEGRVILKFVVDKNGRIKNVENVKKDVDPLLVNEAMRVVKAMPKWNPGKKNGETVNVEFVLPIVFKL
jgi:TonB family protein